MPTKSNAKDKFVAHHELDDAPAVSSQLNWIRHKLAASVSAGMSLFRWPSTKDPTNNVTITRGTKAREEEMKAIDRITTAGGYAGPLRPEQRKAMDALEAEADRWAKNEGAEFLAEASKEGALGPQPKGPKLTPGEIADAFGAKIIGRRPKTLP